MDWNVQCDVDAARIVFEAAGSLTLATLPATMQAHLRAAHLPRLEACGAVGQLLARQARAHAAEHAMTELGRAHAGLPDDLVNFHYDPVACAVALEWPGAVTESMTLRPDLAGPHLRFAEVADGKRADVLVAVEGETFADVWLTAVERLPYG
jgi:inosine-uridine nucleoside N-ribohydrolase